MIDYFIEYIDALIPSMIGLVLIMRPSLFTKSTGETYEKTAVKLKRIGFLLVVVGIGYAVIKLFSHKHV